VSGLFCGIDPGMTGALVVIENDDLEFHDTPIVKMGTKTKLDPARCSALLRDIKSDAARDGKNLLVMIEKVGPMPKQGISSTASFMYGAGQWEGILAALEIPYQFVTPQRWKGLLMDGEPKEKDASRVVARRLWPTQTEEALSRKKDHGRADAALIAEYGRRTAK
jgi:hypothetical protein